MSALLGFISGAAFVAFLTRDDMSSEARLGLFLLTVAPVAVVVLATIAGRAS